MKTNNETYEHPRIKEAAFPYDPNMQITKHMKRQIENMKITFCSPPLNPNTIETYIQKHILILLLIQTTRYSSH